MGVWVQAPSSLSQLSHLEQVTEPNLPLFQNCKVGATDRSFLGLCEINKERHVFRAGTLELKHPGSSPGFVTCSPCKLAPVTYV